MNLISFSDKVSEGVHLRKNLVHLLNASNCTVGQLAKRYNIDDRTLRGHLLDQRIMRRKSTSVRKKIGDRKSLASKVKSVHDKHPNITAPYNK